MKPNKGFELTKNSSAVLVAQAQRKASNNPKGKTISTIESIQNLVASGQVRVSDHGWDELGADDISVRDVVAGLDDAQVIKDYPEFGKGPSVLVLQYDRESNSVHVISGIPKGHDSPTVLEPANRRDPDRWDESFTRRMP